MTELEKNELTLDCNIEAKAIKLLKTFFSVQNGKAKKTHAKTTYQE